MESEFPSNSQVRRPGPKAHQPKNIEKVITGEVIQRKKPLGKRFKETFFTGEDPSTVGRYVVLDVLIPAAKDMIADAFSQGVERFLFGESRASNRRGYRPGMFGQVAYNRFSQPSSSIRHDARPTGASRRGRADRGTMDEIIVSTRVEANQIIDSLIAILSQYEQATVSDLYELLGVTGEFTDESWGWTDLRGADVQRISEGYLINLPRPQPLN